MHEYYTYCTRMSDRLYRAQTGLTPVDRCLVKTRNARWRSAQVIMMGVAGQYSGNGLAYFNTVIYHSASKR
jgi:hypothetical protein